jgi:hypothetical protein
MATLPPPTNHLQPLKDVQPQVRDHRQGVVIVIAAIPAPALAPFRRSGLEGGVRLLSVEGNVLITSFVHMYGSYGV